MPDVEHITQPADELEIGLAEFTEPDQSSFNVSRGTTNSCWQGRITSGSRFPRGDRPSDFLAGRDLGGFKIVSFLKVEPEFGRPTEPPCQPKRSIRRYGAATSNDFDMRVR
ncbi:MAG: hypothetical protein R2845_09800 [Thermomicrobiales bacterium]